MSGGSYDYLYLRLQTAAADINSRHPHSARHRAFADHLELVAKAMHDLESVDSCDYAPGDEFEAIDVVIDPTASLERAIQMARQMRCELDRAIAQAKEKNEKGNGAKGG